MDTLARVQDRREKTMGSTANDLDDDFATALTQVGHQAAQHQEFLRRRQACLVELNHRSQSINNSQRTLAQPADSLVDQRNHDSHLYKAEMQALHHLTVTQDREIRNQNYRDHQGTQNDKLLRAAVNTLNQRLALLGRNARQVGNPIPDAPPTNSDSGYGGGAYLNPNYPNGQEVQTTERSMPGPWRQVTRAIQDCRWQRQLWIRVHCSRMRLFPNGRGR